MTAPLKHTDPEQRQAMAVGYMTPIDHKAPARHPRVMRNSDPSKKEDVQPDERRRRLDDIVTSSAPR